MEQILNAQRTFFHSGATLPLSFRRQMLEALRQEILQQEQGIKEALYEDLGKSGCESYMCEIGMVLEEIRYILKHLRRFSSCHRVHTPLAQFAARSFVKPSPYGNVLIMSPWNYPFLLTIGPLVDALAAGNTAVVKPSAYAPATAQVLKGILEACFPENYVSVVLGGRKENADLLNQKFHMVFFTGSQNVGREVLRHTAETLTPAVLELGGKSPCIVDETADIPLSARRIVFGKLLNCGQTCVAPDYILCQENVKDALLSALKQEMVRQYGQNPLSNPDYGKIINRKHFDRVSGLIEPEKLAHGGETDPEKLKIAPTILDGITWESPVMEQEIFGPILPILTFRQVEDIPRILENRPKPLAFYVFSGSKANIRYLLDRCSFGGGCINDTIIHLATPHMGFGGVGESGMGAYHGKRGFEAFSHQKSIVDKKTFMDLPVRYQPYGGPLREKILHIFMK